MRIKLPTTILKRLILLLHSKHAEDIVALDVRKLSDICDYILICSAKNKVHLETLHDHVLEFFDKYQIGIFAKEGDANTGWIVVDMGDIFLHIFLPEIRNYYNLLRLWGDAKRIDVSLEQVTPQKKKRTTQRRRV